MKAAALREAHQQQRIIISFVSTTEQVADMFTKLLGTMLARRMRFLAGMGTGETRPWHEEAIASSSIRRPTGSTAMSRLGGACVQSAARVMVHIGQQGNEEGV